MADTPIYDILQAEFFSNSAIVANGLNQINHSLQELKSINNTLVTMSKSGTFTQTDLKKYVNSAFTNASTYNQSISEYMDNISAISSTNFKDKEGLASLSATAQSAGNMTSQLANEYLLASDAAFAYHGNIQKLNSLLDSQHQVSKKNTLSMAELASATTTAISQLSTTNIPEDKLTALLGTGISYSGSNGEAVGKNIAGIINNMQLFENKGTAESILGKDKLKEIEDQCYSLGISLYELKNGTMKLREPITIIEEIGQALQGLPSDSPIQFDIASALGGTEYADMFTGIFNNWDVYQNLLSDYQNAAGSAFAAVTLDAQSWEGSLNSLSNTWTSLVNNIANSDGIIAGIGTLDKLLGTVNKFGSMSSPLGMAGILGAGILSTKNVGGENNIQLSPIF